MKLVMRNILTALRNIARYLTFYFRDNAGNYFVDNSGNRFIFKERV